LRAPLAPERIVPMAATVRTRLVRIGNSQGVRIPRALLDRVGLGGEVELEAQGQQLVVRPVPPAARARAGWDERFRAMAERGDDRLLDGDGGGPSRFDAHSWAW
jgi:antitoxin MazE